MSGVVAFQVTSDLLDTVESNGALGLVGNGNVSIVFRAALEDIGIGLGGDCQWTRALCCRSVAVSILSQVISRVALPVCVKVRGGRT